MSRSVAFRPLVLATAFMLSATAAQAGPVTFNDGTTFTSNWVGFDPAPGNVLNVGVNTAATAFAADPFYNPVTGGLNPGGNPNNPAFNFSAYGQANVLGLITSGGTIPLPGGYTFVFGIPEHITNFTGQVGGLNSMAQFTLNPTPGALPNYFQFFKTGGGSDLNGTNFNTGTLVLSGHFTAQGAAPGTFGNSGTTGALDQFLTNNYPNNQTVGGTGNVALKGIVDYANPAFFTTSPGDSLIGGTVNISTQLQLPFIAVDPSAAFLAGTLTTAVGASPVTSGAGLGTQNTGLGIGPINGDGGPPLAPNVQVQQDANITVGVVTNQLLTPEPVSFVVFAGLMGLGGLVYRRTA